MHVLVGQEEFEPMAPSVFSVTVLAQQKSPELVSKQPAMWMILGFFRGLAPQDTSNSLECFKWVKLQILNQFLVKGGLCRCEGSPAWPLVSKGPINQHHKELEGLKGLPTSSANPDRFPLSQ
jgi:hypothetical protein